MTTTTRHERAFEVLTGLENQYGQLVPEEVVEAASDPKSPLHPYFEWNDETAGHAYRLDQARQLIRSYRVEVTVHSHTVDTVQYVHDPRVQPPAQGYVNINHVTAEGIEDGVLDAEIKRIEGVIARAVSIAASLDREKEFRLRLRALLR